MKNLKYLTTAVFGLVLLPVMGAEESENPRNEIDVKNVVYIENYRKINLGFDTAKYLPEDFNPYSSNIPVDSINYIEIETIKLGFDTTDYLPEGFDPYVDPTEVDAISI